MMMAVLVAAGLAFSVSESDRSSTQPPRTTTVLVGDLDLSTSAGTAEMERRLARAIDQVCREAGPMFIEQRERVRKCTAAARASMQGQANKLVEQSLAAKRRALFSQR